MQVYRFAYQLTQADIAAYQHIVKERMNFFTRRTALSKGIAAVLVMLVLPLFLAIADILIPQFGFGPNNMSSFALGVFAGALMVLVLLWGQCLLLRRHSTAPGGRVLSKRELQVSDTGLVSSSLGMVTTLDWSAVKDITESKGYVVLWFEPGSGLLLPPSAFPSAAVRDAFFAHCYEAINETP